MSTIACYNKFVSDAGKAEMIWEGFCDADKVRVTLYGGEEYDGALVAGAKHDPDGSLMIPFYQRKTGEMSHIYLSDIASVERWD